ncbi:MAG TPA: hypothetical protein VK986_14535 [Tepidisphaeraceae bacterium]|nr:hypothetical protein [Tepidisphaeraceae bacterium]
MTHSHVLRFADETGAYQPVPPAAPIDAVPAWLHVGLPCSDELMARPKDLEGADAEREGDAGDC